MAENEEAKPKMFAGAPEKPKRAQMPFWKSMLITLAVGYIALCVLLFLFQNKLVFMPSKAASLAPTDSGYAAQQATSIETKSADGVTLRGWHIGGGKARDKGSPRKLGDAALVVLFFTGNAGNRSDRVDSFRTFNSLFAHVVCFDYRGFGDSDGSPTEEGVAKDARAAWEYVRTQGVPAERIVVYGESIGGAVAIRLTSELCSENTPPGGLVTEATFTRLNDVAKSQYWFVPTGLLLTSKFPSVERITKVTCPILMFHGKKDELVNFALGQQLFAAAPAESANKVPKKFVELANCTHNDIPILGGKTHMDALGDFFQDLAPELERRKREITKPRTPEELKAQKQAPGVSKPGREPVVSPRGNTPVDSKSSPAKTEPKTTQK
jgi:uncharacterized protein